MRYNYKQGAEATWQRLNNKAEIQSRKLPKDDNNFNYANGIKSWIGSIFIDIVDSTTLIQGRSELETAKVLRSFTAEVITILNSSDNVRKIGIRGDCVYAVYATPRQQHIKELFDITVYLNTLIKMLNKLFAQKGYAQIKVGIGMAVGEDLIIKAGKRGTGVNHKIWIGQAVVDASNLANRAGRNGRRSIAVSELAYDNFIDFQQEENNYSRSWFERKDDAYYCNVINTEFDNWINHNL